MSRLGVLLLTVLAVIAGGCGGGDDATTGTTTESTETSGDVTVAAPAWAVPLLSEAGPESAAVMASSDFAVGGNRVTFLLVRDDGSLVRAPTADVYYKPSQGRPTKRVTARLLSIGVDASPAAQDEVKEIYVANLELTRAGKVWVVIRPRGVAFQGFQILDVKAEPTAVAIGDRAPASKNPTLATRPAAKLTTARPPATGLLKYSVAESLRAKVPFVVAFATPAFCASRTCGPTVDVLDAVRQRFESRGVRFIHIEIYEDNNPGKGVNRWVKEWKLPTEPWVYVVDRDGIVRDRFEGAISIPELEASIRRDLLG